jgi:hypothetical protein
VKDGKISLKIPGQEGITDLKEALKDPAGLKQALTEYQSKAAMSERQIAEKSLSTVDNISNDTKIMRELLLRAVDPSVRTEVLEKYKDVVETSVDKTKTAGTGAVGEGVRLISNKEFYDNMIKTKSGNSPEDVLKSKDSLFSSGSKKQFFNEGEVFNFIDDDQALFAPDIDKNLDILKETFLQMKKLAPVLKTEMAVKTEGFKMPELKLPDFSKFEKMFSVKEEKKESKETVQKIEGSGTININVNISSSGDLASSLMSDRRFKNDLETEILNTMKNKDLLMVQKP